MVTVYIWAKPLTVIEKLRKKKKNKVDSYMETKLIFGVQPHLIRKNYLCLCLL